MNFLGPLRPLLPRARLVGPWRRVDFTQLLVDLTYIDELGGVAREQQILDRLFDLIDESEAFLGEGESCSRDLKRFRN